MQKWESHGYIFLYPNKIAGREGKWNKLDIFPMFLQKFCTWIQKLSEYCIYTHQKYPKISCKTKFVMLHVQLFWIVSIILNAIDTDFKCRRTCDKIILHTIEYHKNWLTLDTQLNLVILNFDKALLNKPLSLGIHL